MTSLVTPLQFNIVQFDLYRGSYPREINLPFLRSLRLKYILSLTPEPLTNDPVMAKFCEENGIENIHIECCKKKDNKDKDKDKDEDKSKPKIKKKKKPVPIEYSVVIECVKFLIDRRHYPCYMHCSNGELVTSLVVACLRKFSYWSTVSILNEFLAYNSSINIHERNFIEQFHSEIEIDDLDLKDKVPWISLQHVWWEKESELQNARSTKINGIPGMLPKLKFNSL